MTARDIEQSNLQQVQDLNQRGGRTLSVVDLIEANTLSLEMAAYLLCKVSGGASFLTAARPGGAGKTTLLACLLSFLKPGTRIVTVSDSSRLRPVPADPEKPSCYLAHEIGSGHYYGYIWNEDVTRLLELRERGHIVASCLHADTLPELTSILTQDLRVPESLLSRVGFLLFMHIDRRSLSYRRRVTTVYEAAEDSSGKRGHTLLYQWEPSSDTFSALYKPNADADEISRAKELLGELIKDDVRDFSQVRARIAEFLMS